MKRQRKVYDPESNTLTISHEYEQLSEANEEPWIFLAPIFGYEMMHNLEITESIEVLEGQQLRVFNMTKSEDEGLLNICILADINNKLPLALTMEVKDSNGQTLAFVEGTVYYLEKGPQDIYEVGAANDATIIDQLPSPDAEELLEICKDYRANFLSYVSIVLINPRCQIEVNYINGDVSRAGRYFKAINYGYEYMNSDDDHLNEEAEKDFDSFLQWIEDSNETTLRRIHLWDGKYGHKVTRYDKTSYKREKNIGSFRDIYGYAWPYYQPSGTIIQDEHSRQNNLICLKAYGCLFYFDPEHDYICVKREYLDKHSDEIGTFRFLQEVTEMAQTKEGWWYPCELEWIRVNLGADGEEISRKVNVVTEIYIKIVSEFTEELFDPDNLPKEGDLKRR